MLTEKHLKTGGNSLNCAQNLHQKDIKGYYLTKIFEK
jgi:hypothetical protein